MPGSLSKPLHTRKLIFSCNVQDTSDENRAAMYREDAEHHDVTFLQVRHRSMLITWHVISAHSSNIGVCLLLHTVLYLAAELQGCTMWLCHVTTSSGIDMGASKWSSLDLQLLAPSNVRSRAEAA